MSLFDELARDSKDTGRQKCSLVHILATFPPEQVNDLQKALADPAHITSAAIARKLQAEPYNYDVSELTVARHRRHACSC